MEAAEAREGGRRPGRRRACGPAKASACRRRRARTRSVRQEQPQTLQAAASRMISAIAVTSGMQPITPLGSERSSPSITIHRRSGRCTMSSSSVSGKRFLIGMEPRCTQDQSVALRGCALDVACRSSARSRCDHSSSRSDQSGASPLCHLPRIRDSRRLLWNLKPPIRAAISRLFSILVDQLP